MTTHSPQRNNQSGDRIFRPCVSLQPQHQAVKIAHWQVDTLAAVQARRVLAQSGLALCHGSSWALTLQAHTHQWVAVMWVLSPQCKATFLLRQTVLRLRLLVAVMQLRQPCPDRLQAMRAEVQSRPADVAMRVFLLGCRAR